MSNQKELVCVLLPVISQNEVFFLGAKNKVKSKADNKKKETIHTLINGTVEKYETPTSAAKRIIYDKFDIILDSSVPAQIVETSTEGKTIHFVFIDKLFDFEQFPLVNIAADVQEVILVNETTKLSFKAEKELVDKFINSDFIDEKFGEWEEESLKSVE